MLKIVADALAVTNNRPDLVLLLIGANDIGRGRDPYYVATNDMPALLDLLLTNVPGVQIILSKISSLQSATRRFSPPDNFAPSASGAGQRSASIACST